MGLKVSFGIFETEEQAARQYDRALVIEKGRSAKTNFPLCHYEAEVEQYKAMLRDRQVINQTFQTAARRK